MKRKIKLNTIYNKMLLVCLILLILPSSIIGIESYVNAKNELDRTGRVVLKNSVHQVLQLIDTKQKMVSTGKITVQEAQEDVKTMILGKKSTDGTRPINKEIDLGDNGYIFILDPQGNTVAHPSTEGKSMWDVKDKSGDDYYFSRVIIEKSYNDGGFTEYSWELPNSKKIGPKITYSHHEENWDWVVVAGTYEMDFNEGATNILRILLITLAVALIIGSIITLKFSKYISEPIKQITDSLERVADGDLTVEEIVVKNNDETGILADASNKMIINLKTLLKSVKESSDSVLDSASSLSEISSQTAKATDEVAQTISEIANTSTEQAGDVEEGATQINELGNDIQQVVNISDEMNNVSSITDELTKKGLDIVEALTLRTFESNKATVQVSNVIFKVNDSTKQISSITEAISKIAEQTNLLALNASIEAARAGEAGRGFAVVADEIRKLAEQSSKSVKDIDGILQIIKSNSEVAVTSIGEAKKIADEQNQAVENTKEIFGDISSSILDLTHKVSNVTNSSISMNKKKESIISMIENLSAISEETAAATEEVSASTEEQTASIQQVAAHANTLNDLSNNLLSIVNKFKIK